MPVQSCTKDGKSGYKFGEEGFCYTYESGNEASRKEAKRKAFLQGAAIGMNMRVAFEPFDKLDLTKPIRLIPEGKWYRGERILDITASRLKEIVRNFKAGLPNYRPPVNLDHADGQGKVGNIKDVAYLEGGVQGSGLYVTEFEFTDKGKKAAEEDGYDGVSAEIAWSLNGSSYQDPKTGKEHDNVLVGMALTPVPFFGHGEVALYTANAERAHDMEYQYRPYGGAVSFEDYDTWLSAQKMQGEIHMTTSILRDLIENVLNDDEIEDKGDRISSLAESYQARIEVASEQEHEDEMSFIKRIKAAVGMNTDQTPDRRTDRIEVIEPASQMIKESDIMADKPVETKPEPIQPVPVTTEILSQKIEAQAEALKAEKVRADKLEADLKAERLARRKEHFRDLSKTFKALPVEVETFAEKAMALEEQNPDLSKWMIEQFTAFDAALVEAGLLREIGSELEANLPPASRFLAAVEAKLKETFKGDRMKYAEALEIVGKEKPDLAKAYHDTVQ